MEDETEALTPEGAPDTGAPGSDAPPGQRETRRAFLLTLARASAVVPPLVLTMRPEPLGAQTAYWASYFQRQANRAAQAGNQAAANFFQALANAFGAQQQGGLSPASATSVQGAPGAAGPGNPAQPWQSQGTTPPPWAAPPPTQGGPPATGGD